MKRVAIPVLLVGSMGFLMGQAKPQSQKENVAPWQKQVIRAGTIQCSKVELLSQEGNLRGKLVADRFGSGASLLMFDKAGTPSVSLTSVISPKLIMGTLQEQSNFSEGYIAPLAGKPTVQLSGSESGGYLLLTDKNGKETATLQTFSDPASGLPDGTHLSLVSDTPSLLLGKHGGYQTVIGTTDLVTKATGQTHLTSAASIVLFDREGNVIWSADNEASGGLAAANFIAIQNAQRTVDDLERQFREFKDGACPILRTARIDWETKIKVDSICGLR
jgi:hypothetical protein